MIIKEDFSQKIIVSAIGEYQIKLLILICENIYNINNKTNHVINNKNYLIEAINIIKKDNLRPEYLYLFNTENGSLNKGTCYTRQKLQTFYKFGSKANFDTCLINWNNKYNLSEYKLINMKEFINLYGKYLFNNNINIRDKFVNDYPELKKCNVMKAIKQIPF